MVRIYRQGDVVLKTIKRLPKNSTVTGEKLEVASETGNPHQLKGKVYMSKGQQYVVLETEATIQHPQHNELRIPAGIYAVSNVHARDYAPRQTMD